MALLERLPDIDSEVSKHFSGSPENSEAAHDPKTEQHVGHTAVASEGVAKPGAEYSSLFPGTTTEEEDMAAMRTLYEATLRAEQDALDKFRIKLPSHEKLVKAGAGAAVFAIGEKVLRAPAFENRRVRTADTMQVDFIDEAGEAAELVISETVAERGQPVVTIVDNGLYSDHREVRVTATESDSEHLEVAIADDRGGELPMIITDGDLKARYVEQVLRDVARLARMTSAVHSPRARQLAIDAFRTMPHVSVSATDLRGGFTRGRF